MLRWKAKEWSKKMEKKITATAQLPIVSALCTPLSDSPRAMHSFCAFRRFFVWPECSDCEIDPFIDAAFSRALHEQTEKSNFFFCTIESRHGRVCVSESRFHDTLPKKHNWFQDTHSKCLHLVRHNEDVYQQLEVVFKIFMRKLRN